MKHKYYIYGFLFPKGDIEIGIFSLDMNLWEGDTDENISRMTATLCDKKKWDINKVKALSFKEIDESFIKGIVDVEGGLLRLGNVRAQGEGKSST